MPLRQTVRSLLSLARIASILSIAVSVSAESIPYDFNFSSYGSGTFDYDDMAMDIDQLVLDFGAFGSHGPTSFGSSLTLSVFGAPPNLFVNNDNTFFGLSGGTAHSVRLNSNGTFCIRPNGDSCGAEPGDLATGTYRIAPVPSFIEVDVDIKPGSDPNSLNLCSNGTVPVAILGSERFDVYDVSTETLRFAGSLAKIVGKKDPSTLCSYEDINGDWIDDLICHYITADIAALDGDSTVATVNGNLFDETPIQGADNVEIVKDTCQ